MKLKGQMHRSPYMKCDWVHPQRVMSLIGKGKQQGVCGSSPCRGFEFSRVLLLILLLPRLQISPKASA